MILKKNVLLIPMFFLLFACAAHYEFGDLINGYKVHAMNPKEIYIQRPNGELIAGPQLRSIAIVGDVLIAKQYGDSDRTNIKYDVINTVSGSDIRGLSQSEMQSFFEDRTLVSERFKNVSFYFAHSND